MYTDLNSCVHVFTIGSDENVPTIQEIFKCTFTPSLLHRPPRNATNPNAISSRSALLGSLVLLLTPRFTCTGGIFSFPGSSLRTRFVRPVLIEGLRFLLTILVEGISDFSDGRSVSSKTTVAFPPIPSLRRIDGVLFITARFGAEDDRQVVSKDGFWILFVFGDNGS